MIDDVHNSRLRERPKKDSSTLMSGQNLVSTREGSGSRGKRKRQGSQEIQVQARSSPADDLEETTDDTEMGVSEDDDDPPPPIIPRRLGKPRPQGKVSFIIGNFSAGSPLVDLICPVGNLHSSFLSIAQHFLILISACSVVAVC